MYLAEIRGKLSGKIENSEDILTSNVFSFFKYANRQLFLKRFLANNLRIHVSDEDAENAEFLFWPRYTDRTEPDLVLIVGKYYLLIEAKFQSPIDWEQLLREYENGSFEANNLDKEFYLIALTADYLKPEQFQPVRIKLHFSNFRWINWQQIMHFLLETLEQEGLPSTIWLFCQDLCELLEGKNLHSFRDFNGVLNRIPVLQHFRRIFFAYETAALRGDFIGFQNTLSHLERMAKLPQWVFFEGQPLFAGLSDKKEKN